MTYYNIYLNMFRIIIFFFSFLIAGCNAKESFINPLKPEFEYISFDVVQKKLVIEQDLPEHVGIILQKWFDQRINIDGFDGEMKFIVSNYNQNISSIDDGKRVDILMSFKVLLNKPSLSKTRLIEGNISSYGTLTGNFSLKEFDTIIQNTQSDLVIRLSKDLKSKI